LFDCPGFHCPGFDCPGFDCPSFDCTDFDCPGFDCPGFDCPGFDGSPIDLCNIMWAVSNTRTRNILTKYCAAAYRTHYGKAQPGSFCVKKIGTKTFFSTIHKCYRFHHLFIYSIYITNSESRWNWDNRYPLSQFLFHL